MLVLSRSVGEKIVVGENLVITVVGMKGDRVRLGFEAPKELPIHRKEVFDSLKAEMHGGEVPSLPDRKGE